MIETPDPYEFVSMVDFADHMVREHKIDYEVAYNSDRYKLHELHTQVHTYLNEYDARRILDLLLAINNDEPYPLNDITRTHLEEIIEKIDYQLDTGWTGLGYTIWMEGVGP
jgi:hypothetical protein